MNPYGRPRLKDGASPERMKYRAYWRKASMKYYWEHLPKIPTFDEPLPPDYIHGKYVCGETLKKDEIEFE